MPRSPFADDWHAAQEQHFQHILRTGDAGARRDAIALMQQAGYDEAAIQALYIRATMHMDDIPPDFVPDMEVIEKLREVQHPQDCTCPGCTPRPKKGSP